LRLAGNRRLVLKISGAAWINGPFRSPAEVRCKSALLAIPAAHFLLIKAAEVDQSRTLASGVVNDSSENERPFCEVTWTVDLSKCLCFGANDSSRQKPDMPGRAA